jgi:nitroimidazol reductase NimA-like FMN-containing flavoprotein (pyridoxamine 5'-phosphate oxidase superfamily)
MRLGLSEYALATQAGMAPRYLRHLLEAGPDFDPGGFLRIAAVLGMGFEELLAEGGGAPGQGPPGLRPALARLTVSECWDLLGVRGVGRIALPSRPGPAVFPVNYAVDGRSVLYRTAPGGAAAPEPGTEVSFQADRVDERMSRGWSVLVTGTAERVGETSVVRRLATEYAVEPWAGGDRPLWIRVRPGDITGRRIGTM